MAWQVVRASCNPHNIEPHIRLDQYLLRQKTRHGSIDIPWDILHGVSEADERLWHLDGWQMCAEDRWTVLELSHGTP